MHLCGEEQENRARWGFQQMYLRTLGPKGKKKPIGDWGEGHSRWGVEYGQSLMLCMTAGADTGDTAG